LGGVQARRREWKAAVKAYDAYLSKVPGDYGARRELGRALAVLGQEGDAAARAQAVRELERAISDAGDDSSFRSATQEELFVARYGPAGRAYLDGRTLFASGDFRAAAQKLELVVKEHPEIEEAQYTLGLAYLTPEVNRRADALKTLAKAPKLKEARLQLGMSCTPMAISAPPKPR
jgi:tetratricopeptide (TPR) repeat protein